VPDTIVSLSDYMLAFLWTKWSTLRLINRSTFRKVYDLELMFPMVSLTTKQTEKIFNDVRIQKLTNRDNTVSITDENAE